MREVLPSGTPVELARPSGARLGVVVAPDIGGLRPLFDDLVTRLAEDNGWAVAAPEPFPGREQMTMEERFAAMAGLSDARQLADLEAAAVATGCDRVSVVGFCMGGMYALKAATVPRFARAVAFYGMIRLPDGWAGPEAAEPLALLAGRAHCPVLALCGGEDPYTPPADVDALRGVDGVEVVVYPDAGHGFVHDPSRPGHRADDAADAWRRAVEFLGAT